MAGWNSSAKPLPLNACLRQRIRGSRSGIDVDAGKVAALWESRTYIHRLSAEGPRGNALYRQRSEGIIIDVF
jgi:hypothetical protein